MTCDLNLTEDQRQILDAAAAMLEVGYPMARLRGAEVDDMAAIAEFGGFLLSVPEEGGGAGFSIVEEALMHVLLGRNVVSTRALAAALAVRLTMEAGQDGLFEEVAAGASGVCAAVPSAEGLLLVDPAEAALAMVFGDRQLALVEIGAGGAPVEGLGHGWVRLARLGGVTPLAESDSPFLLGLADLLVSAQLLGVAEAARDLACAYAQVRQQFGKPIGAQQAIKHRAANMAIGAEMISAQLDMAAIALRDGRVDAGFQLAALRRLAPRVAFENARACVQIHGGMGFSAEADAHHFVKQAHVLARLGRPEPMLRPAAALAPHVAATT